MSDAPRTPTTPASVDPTTALQVRVLRWYLAVVLVGLTLLWGVVPRIAPTTAIMTNALLPTILVFNLICLGVLQAFPRQLRALQLAQYASFFPFLLGYLALTLAEAGDAAGRQAVIAWFAVWIPVVVVVAFHRHATGDALLRTFAERVQETVRASDTVGRLGGDEFVVLASVAGDAEARTLADRLIAACAETVTIGGTAFELSVSIGIALHPRDGADRSVLLRAADEAMYVAKAAGRNRWSARSEPEPTRSTS